MPACSWRLGKARIAGKRANKIAIGIVPPSTPSGLAQRVISHPNGANITIEANTTTSPGLDWEGHHILHHSLFVRRVRVQLVGSDWQGAARCAGGQASESMAAQRQRRQYESTLPVVGALLAPFTCEGSLVPASSALISLKIGLMACAVCHDPDQAALHESSLRPGVPGKGDRTLAPS